MSSHYGIAGRFAREFRVERWLWNVGSELQISQIQKRVITLGHAPGNPPSIMEDCRTGGTP
jgi:hypothetical protein